MRDRSHPFRRLLTPLIAVAVAAAALGSSPATAVAAGPKVAIIVGPTGSLTSYYRSSANEVAEAALAAGATVAKAYSPRATWSRVKNAVDGASVIVYFGHGNGFPSPYSGTENTDRVNGWGLNRTTQNGHGDNWSKTMVYCGEKALLGTLTASDGAAQRQYCKNGPITPAPGFVMVYAQAHYAPGFGERYQHSDPVPSRSKAQQRVRNYSYPVLQLGASAFFATAYGDADEIVNRVLTRPDWTFGRIFRNGRGFDGDALRKMNHPDIAKAKVWVQKTKISSLHFGDPDYWYAFAGAPWTTPGENMHEPAALASPEVVQRRPAHGATGVAATARVRAWFDMPVKGVNRGSFRLRDEDGERVPARVVWHGAIRRATLIPDTPLEDGVSYRVTLRREIRSQDGVALDLTFWRFRVASGI